MGGNIGNGVIRVVIADDHTVVRRGTREILEQGDASIEVIGEAGDGSEAVDLVCDLVPDVAIFDIGMPALSGVEATRRAKARCPDVAVLILTVQNSSDYVWRAIEAGASGYLLKDSDAQTLIDAVRTVAGGGSVLDETLTPVLLERLRGGIASPQPTDLTPRELQVLTEAAGGSSNRAIAELLGLSVRTVEVHMSSVLAKLEARSRTEAVMTALRLGLVEVPELQ